MTARGITTRGPFSMVWRTAGTVDVYHAEIDGAIDCFEPGPRDPRTGISQATAETFEAAADQWYRDRGDYYKREVAFL